MSWNANTVESAPAGERTAAGRGEAAYRLLEFHCDDTLRLHVHRAPEEDYRLLVPLSGELTVRRSGRRTRLVPGTGALVTPAEPLEAARAAGTRGLVLTIPAPQVDGPLRRSAPRADRLDLRTGLGRLVADLLTGLVRERRSLTGAEFDAACDRLVELLCMVAERDGHGDASARLAEVAALVRRYVRAHAADPELTGAVIAQDLGWSLRQVQLALQHSGTTPRELIREERLRLARRLLQDPSHAHLPITDLAYAAGFSSPSALSTAFRHRYGTTPSELRRSALAR